VSFANGESGEEILLGLQHEYRSGPLITSLVLFYFRDSSKNKKNELLRNCNIKNSELNPEFSLPS
jgi:hypothetical protein